MQLSNSAEWMMEAGHQTLSDRGRVHSKTNIDGVAVEKDKTNAANVCLSVPPMVDCQFLMHFMPPPSRSIDKFMFIRSTISADIFQTTTTTTEVETKMKCSLHLPLATLLITSRVSFCCCCCFVL